MASRRKGNMVCKPTLASGQLIELWYTVGSGWIQLKLMLEVRSVITSPPQLPKLSIIQLSITSDMTELWWRKLGSGVYLWEKGHVFLFCFVVGFFSFSFVDVAPPSNIIMSSDQTITAPAKPTLNCLADGKPKPTIFWTRVSDNTNVSMPLNITGGKNEESYRCKADNGIGNPLTKVIKITILCEWKK